jgi:hypothetical protein
MPRPEPVQATVDAALAADTVLGAEALAEAEEEADTLQAVATVQAAAVAIKGDKRPTPHLLGISPRGAVWRRIGLRKTST